MKFQDKVALVTGASRGIGRATAEEFAKNGANVVINYQNSKEVAEKFAAELQQKYGVQAVAIQADISSENDVMKMRDEIMDTFGKLNMLVNNAGVVVDKDFSEHTKEDFQKLFMTNVYGTFFVSKVFGEMIKNTVGTGAIVNISSTSGLLDFWPDNIDYAATKAAVASMTHDLAIQFAPDIRVNAVAPGWADTDMNKDLPEDFVNKENEKYLLRRMGKPEELARPIVFLASDDASFVNSALLVVDGGRY
ncbi:MAG: glucose 1-dehydrogenase [Candidatus Nomurabacteria bacterium]|nr:glucose 1-dehydrogenase [Candidatus Nomurabacteria bacterium]